MMMKKILAALLSAAAIGATCVLAAEPMRVLNMDDAAGVGTANGAVTYSAGAVNKAARLTNNAYLSLPAMTMPDEFTISMWVKPDSVDQWARAFDFGTGTQKYMFLTLSNGSDTVFAITNNYSGAEQKITAPIAFKAGEWTHIAVTRSGSTGILYVNGIEAGRNDEMTVKASQLGSLNKNYIGKSQYNDPYLNGAVDELRIYSSAISAADAAELAVPEGIASVETNIKLTTDLDIAPELPKTVAATLTDGSVCHIPAAWEGYDKSMLSGGGVFTVNGTAGDKAITAEITVNGLVITPDISMDESSVVTASFHPC